MKEQLAGQSVKILIKQAVGFFEADAVGTRWVRSHPSWKSIWVGFHPKFRRRHRSLISAQQSVALRVLARTNKPHQNPMGQGAQPPARLIGLYQGLFQSTRPRGARPGTATGFWTYARCFNPRAREGRDTRCNR